MCLSHSVAVTAHVQERKRERERSACISSLDQGISFRKKIDLIAQRELHQR